MQRAEHGEYCLQEAGAVHRDAAKQYLLLADREGFSYWPSGKGISPGGRVGPGMKISK